jgi:hypothetical protein
MGKQQREGGTNSVTMKKRIGSFLATMTALVAIGCQRHVTTSEVATLVSAGNYAKVDSLLLGRDPKIMAAAALALADANTDQSFARLCYLAATSDESIRPTLHNVVGKLKEPYRTRYVHLLDALVSK